MQGQLAGRSACSRGIELKDGFLLKALENYVGSEQ